MSSTAIEQLERRANGRSFLELRLSSTSGVNPMSGSTVAGIREILRTQAANPDLHGLFISAEGRLFCAGADVKEFAAFDVQDFRAYMTDILAMYLEMTRFPKPIASLVHADALGAGAVHSQQPMRNAWVSSTRCAMPVRSRRWHARAHRQLQGACDGGSTCGTEGS